MQDLGYELPRIPILSQSGCPAKPRSRVGDTPKQGLILCRVLPVSYVCQSMNLRYPT